MDKMEGLFLAVQSTGRNGSKTHKTIPASLNASPESGSKRNIPMRRYGKRLEFKGNGRYIKTASKKGLHILLKARCNKKNTLGGKPELAKGKINDLTKFLLNHLFKERPGNSPVLSLDRTPRSKVIKVKRTVPNNGKVNPVARNLKNNHRIFGWLHNGVYQAAESQSRKFERNGRKMRFLEQGMVTVNKRFLGKSAKKLETILGRANALPAHISSSLGQRGYHLQIELGSFIELLFAEVWNSETLCIYNGRRERNNNRHSMLLPFGIK